MVLKKLTLKEKEIKILKEILKFLLQFDYVDDYGEEYSYFECVEFLFENSELSFNNLKDNIEFDYGWTDDKNDKELILAKILFLCKIFNLFNEYFVQTQEEDTDYIIWNIKFEKIQEDLNNNLVDYKIDWEDYTFESTINKTIVDNVENIELSIAEKIKQLLIPLTNKDEVYGIITQLCNDIDFALKDKKLILDKLNNDQKSIFNKTSELCKFLANKKFRHKDTTLKNLNFRDIAHNFALLCSLFFKIIENNK